MILEEIAMHDDDPSDVVHDQFAEALFGGTPLGRPDRSAPSTRSRRSTRGAIDGYYRRRYRPENMVVAVAGNVDHAAVVRLVRKAFCARRLARRATPAVATAAPAVAAHHRRR